MNLPVPLYALVLEEELRVGKNGKQFWQVIIKTTDGNFKAFMWGAKPDAANDLKYPHVGDVIEITDFKDNVEEYGSVVIGAFRRMTKEALPADAKEIVEFAKASDEDIAWAWSVIEDSSFWDEPRFHKYTMDCIRAVGRDKFAVCPAATHVHHHYQGGLLVHTAEVLDLARAVTENCSKRYSFFKKDVVYASAILHDIGKVTTYYINDMGVATSLRNEKTIGHLFYGMSLFQSGLHEDSPWFADGFIEWGDEVLHCIASHHGLPDWGSLKVVQSLEAGVISRVDYISSRNGMVEKVLNEAVKTERPLQDTFKIYGDPYFASIGMKEYVERAGQGQD